MSTYKIVSDRFALGKQGANVSADALEGLNVDALVASGHLEPASVSNRKTEKKEQD